jgi:hypothetical protein
MCVICELCLTAVPLPLGKNPLAVKIIIIIIIIIIINILRYNTKTVCLYKSVLEFVRGKWSEV